MGGYAWVTLATNDSYSLGALVLAHSLRSVKTKHDLAVLVTPGVTATMREKLSAVFTLVQEVNVLDSKDEANLALLARPELGITFTKLHCWRLTQYEKCVFVDADALVIRNCDELFEREELSAAPDVGWPDCFNSGVFVYRPSADTFTSLMNFATAKGSFDGGDQGLLNQYFSDWARNDIAKHLPFIYNMCSTATYSYLPAFKQYGDDVRIIHFIGSTKPWLQYFDTISGEVHPAPGTNHLQPLLQLWWNIFCDKVHPELSPVMAGIAGALAKLTLGEARSLEQIAFEEHMRKQSWEQGQIDYMGRDSFDNIWKKISETIGSQPARQASPPKAVPKSEQAEIDDKCLLAGPVEAGLEAVTVAAALLELECKVDKEDSLIDEFALKDEVRKLISPLTELTKVEIDEPKTIVADKMAGLEGKAATEVENLELPTESQVPIQVAESVLEADVKESVAEDLKPITEEAISSISVVAQESVPAVLETAMEAVDSNVPRSNGSSDVTLEIGNGVDALEIASSARIAVVEDISVPVDTRLPVAEEIAEDIEKLVTAPSAVESSREKEKSELASCCASAETSLPIDAPVTQSETLSCPLIATKTIEELPVKVDDATATRDSQINVFSVGTVVSETTVGKEVPEVSAGKAVSGKSVEVSMETVGKEIPEGSVDKKVSDDSVGKEEFEETVGKVDLALPVEKEEPKESIGKVVSEDSVGKEVPKESVDKKVPKGTVDNVLEASVGKECRETVGKVDPAVSVGKEDPEVSIGKEDGKKSIGKEDTKKSIGKEDTKKSIGKEVPEDSVGKEVPKKSVDKEILEVSADKKVPEGSVGKESIGKVDAAVSIGKEDPKKSVGKEVFKDSVGKEVPKRSVDKEIPQKSTDKEVPKVTVDKEVSETSIGKEESEESISKVDPSLFVGKEAPKGSTGKEVSKDSVGKEVPKKSAEKVVVKKPADKDGHKRSIDKKVPKVAIDKELPKKSIEKVAAASVDKEVSGESSEASLSIEDSSSPLRPTRTKEMQIPDTPTVIEATPPTSPPIDGAVAPLDEQAVNKTTKKIVKKIVKKTSETKSPPETSADTDTDVKKSTKKIVKKSTKKKEDDPNAPIEAKKVIKSVKKATTTTTTTTSKTLDVAEATAPETPPPSAPDVPVPPKRKLKTNTKTTSQKSDSEP